MSQSRSQLTGIFARCAQFSYDNATWVMVFFFILIVGLGGTLVNMKMDLSTEGTLHPSDPVRVQYDEFRRQFGRDDLIVVAIPINQQLGDEQLRQLAQLQQAIEDKVPYVEKVTSLINARRTRGDQDTLIVENLLQDWPQHHWQPDTLLPFVQLQPNYRDRLVTQDGQFSALLIRLQSTTNAESTTVDPLSTPDLSQINSSLLSGDAFLHQDDAFLSQGQSAEAVAELRDIIQAYPKLKIAMTGTPVILETMNRMTIIDSSISSTSALLIVIVFLSIFFRRASGVIMPLIVVNGSIIASMGVMVLAGSPYTLTTGTIGPLMFAVGIADSVHILAYFYKRYDQTNDSRSSIIYAVGHTAPAVMMTSLTTAAGFLSFVVGDLASIAEMGIYTAVAVMFALIMTVFLLPAIIGRFRIKQANNSLLLQTRLENGLISIGRFSTSYPKTISISAVLIIIASGIGATQLRFSNDVISYFGEEVITRQDVLSIDKAFNGTSAIEIVIDSGESGGLYNVDFIQRLQTASKRLSHRNLAGLELADSYSILNILRETHQALHENQPSYYQVPQQRQQIAQEILLFESNNPEDLWEVTDPNLRLARLTLKTTYEDGVAYQDLLAAIEYELQDIFADSATFSITGSTALTANSVPRALTTMVKSYAIALLIITAFMLIMIGNWRIGLLSMIPNILPLLLITNVMVLLDWPLDLTTIMVGAIALGIVVDDTLHFLYHYQQNWQRHGDAVVAVDETISGTGRALLITTIIYASAAFTNTFGSMNNVIIFGFTLSGVTILALLADLIVAPALLVWLHQNKQPQTADNEPLNTIKTNKTELVDQQITV